MKPDTPTKEIDTLLGPNRFPKVWEQRYIGSFSPTQRFSNLLIFHLVRVQCRGNSRDRKKVWKIGSKPAQPGK